MRGGLEHGGVVVHGPAGRVEQDPVQRAVVRVQRVHVPLRADGVLHRVALCALDVPYEVRVPEVSPVLDGRPQCVRRHPAAHGALDIIRLQAEEGRVLLRRQPLRHAVAQIVLDSHAIDVVHWPVRVRDARRLEALLRDVRDVERRRPLLRHEHVAVPRLPARLGALDVVHLVVDALRERIQRLRVRPGDVLHLHGVAVVRLLRRWRLAEARQRVGRHERVHAALRGQEARGAALGALNVRNVERAIRLIHVLVQPAALGAVDVADLEAVGLVCELRVAQERLGAIDVIRAIRRPRLGHEAVGRLHRARP
mmetsp:Transcript_7996/g.22824  ORF Transcript_7996/g.22824 Transcript_7996/m.22824 type:complete len:310 (-) Transcript_7996:263-1192(-)